MTYSPACPGRNSSTETFLPRPLGTRDPGPDLAGPGHIGCARSCSPVAGPVERDCRWSARRGDRRAAVRPGNGRDCGRPKRIGPKRAWTACCRAGISSAAGEARPREEGNESAKQQGIRRPTPAEDFWRAFILSFCSRISGAAEMRPEAKTSQQDCDGRGRFSSRLSSTPARLRSRRAPGGACFGPGWAVAASWARAFGVAALLIPGAGGRVMENAFGGDSNWKGWLRLPGGRRTSSLVPRRRRPKVASPS